MKQGIGFSVTINIIAIFIVVTFAFLVTSLNYYKAYKINNAISDSIEKYEGYNALAVAEIDEKLDSLGYVKNNAGCDNSFPLTKTINSAYKNSYCISEISGGNNYDADGNRFTKYIIVTYINFNIPIINETLNLKVRTNTEKIYYFGD